MPQGRERVPGGRGRRLGSSQTPPPRGPIEGPLPHPRSIPLPPPGSLRVLPLPGDGRTGSETGIWVGSQTRGSWGCGNREGESGRRLPSLGFGRGIRSSVGREDANLGSRGTEGWRWTASPVETGDACPVSIPCIRRPSCASRVPSPSEESSRSGPLPGLPRNDGCPRGVPVLGILPVPRDRRST